MTASVVCDRPVCGRPIHWIPRIGEWQHTDTRDARCHQWDTNSFRAAPAAGTHIPNANTTRVRLHTAGGWT